MAEIRELNGARARILEPEHLVGRGRQCALRLEPSYVSAQHAVIRWNGSTWEVIDRGSRNGTQLDGQRLEPGRSYKLTRGAVLAFGHQNELWRLTDIAEPQVMVVDLDPGIALLASDGIIGVPSAQDPECTIYRDIDLRWMLESPDAPLLAIKDGYTFDVAGRSYRFCCPLLFDSTAAADGADRAPATLSFAVSSDEEFVELALEYPNQLVKLGCRAQNYLLLILARARLADQEAGIPEPSCGWTCKEQLAEDLRITPQQVDGEVFRIRKHFGQHRLEEAAFVIERRSRTKQVRLGIPHVRIKRV